MILTYAKQNYVSHTLIDQSSIVCFIEDNWLGGQRLSSSSFDQIAGSILDRFDFSQQPTGTPCSTRRPDAWRPRPDSPVHNRRALRYAGSNGCNHGDAAEASAALQGLSDGRPQRLPAYAARRGAAVRRCRKRPGGQRGSRRRLRAAGGRTRSGRLRPHVGTVAGTGNTK
ncbi:MAG TPA: hypothetical protein VFA70_15765 [Dehalococcoidia bacterium]|nr:hypothetical protein [Dehalococcoidia bacterium]